MLSKSCIKSLRESAVRADIQPNIDISYIDTLTSALTGVF